MRLVKTLNPVMIDPMLKISKQIYFEIGEEIRPINTPIDVVEIEIKQYSIDVAYRNETKTVKQVGQTPVEVEIIRAYPYPVYFRSTKAMYKRSTFKSNFNDLDPEDFATAFIQQVDWVTHKWELTEANQEGGWTGQEIQRPRYYDLKAADMAIVTNGEYENLFTPYEVVFDEQ